MVQEVLVGLLAAAFAFLCVQLVNLGKEAERRIMEEMEKDDGLSPAWRVAKEWKWIGKRWEGKDGLNVYHGDVVLGIGLSYFAVFVSLLLYVLSVVVLIAGYWFAGDVVIAVGLGLLMSAFGSCGVSLCVYYVTSGMVYRAMAKMFYEKREEVRDGDDDE